ncbi:MAG: zinc ABC transporter substrate-binding protein [Pseudomonadota bacterium]|nr:zinc ABC transporter substrate-binding protein [Pseudomonadota bacterium]
MRLTLATALLAPLPALAEPPMVVTDIAPVHSLVSQVMAGVAEPTLLLDGSADPHSVALRPSQARVLEQAQLVVWVGEELEPWLARALEGLSRAENIALLDLPSTTLRDFDGSPAHLDDGLHEDHDDHEAEDHADEDHHDHDDHAEEDHGHDDHAIDEGDHDHAHSHEGTDPHAWLSPDNARAWLAALADELAARDPENAETYRANAEAAIVEVTQMDAEITAKLAPYEGTEIVTFHDAFGYFTTAYGIEVLGSLRAGDASAPSAAALSDLRGMVAEHGVTCAFSEPAADEGLLRTIEQDVGLRSGVLDATGATLTPGPELYGDLMTGLATTIATCLSGD